jgi:type II secretory pathway pseudopilin PulG
MMRRVRRDDRGETLVELIVAVAILGTAVVAIVGAIGTAIHLSEVHRRQAQAGVYVRSFGEAIENKVNGSPTGYKACAAKSDYRTMYSDAIGAYTATVVDIYRLTTTNTWVSITSGTCNPSDDIGVQRVSLQVSNGQVSENLDIVIRRPCRPTDTDASCS